MIHNLTPSSNLNSSPYLYPPLSSFLGSILDQVDGDYVNGNPGGGVGGSPCLSGIYTIRQKNWENKCNNDQ